MKLLDFVDLCQRYTQTSLSHPPSDIRRMLLVLGPDVTHCIVAALCLSVSSSQSVSWEWSVGELGGFRVS